MGRRNLVFDMATGTDLCTDTVGSGNGMRISHTPDAEIYHNTFYNLRGTAITLGDNGGSVTRADVINNIVQKAGTGFSRGSVSTLTVQKNVFRETQGIPSGSIVADPMFVDDPRNNDFYTKPGSRSGTSPCASRCPWTRGTPPTAATARTSAS